MNTDTNASLAVLLARKWLILAAVLVATAATYAISSNLEKVYSTEATLLVALPSDDQTFDTLQAGQAVAQSYAELIQSPNIAEDVAEELGSSFDTGDVLAATSFESIPETQLLVITAEASRPPLAKEIADTYAEVFTDYARLNLRDTTDAAIELADPAPLPGSAARPQPALYTIVAGLIALVLAVALVLAISRLDRRLRTSEEFESRFGLPLLSRVPVRRRSSESVSAFEEAYRVLRTNMQFVTEGRHLRSLGIMSESAGEGKTTSVAKLAEAVAEAGRQVIVVEADFRRPALRSALMSDGAGSLGAGLSNFLVGTASLSEVVHGTNRPNLSIVPSGPLPPSPSALLDSNRGRELFQELTDRCDLLIADCPPLSVGADAAVTSKWVDGVLLVVDMKSATDRSVRNALRQLGAVRATVVGVLLNRDPGVDGGTYDYYRAERTRASTRLPRLRRATSRPSAMRNGSEDGASHGRERVGSQSGA